LGDCLLYVTVLKIIEVARTVGLIFNIIFRNNGLDYLHCGHFFLKL
jgi:hypothetical protein